MDFIYNNGWNHRGVWHITNNLEKTETPASTEDKCWNALKITYIKPAFVTYRGDSICGQTDKLKTGGLDWGKDRVTPNGQVRQYKAVRPEVVIGLDGYIPGPLCSRCAKQAGIKF
jgi:hypothetical protein